jgi:glycosyltransferase involved in cell wall biosynthesis
VAIELSVVVPMYDEAANVARIAHELMAALCAYSFEIILVDDGSRDDTLAEALRLRAVSARVHVVRHSVRCGQSAAVCSGVFAARAAWIVTIDGDCQNDPRDIPSLLSARDTARDQRVRLIMGCRGERHDSSWRRVQSRVANAVRGWLLRDDTPDGGCGLKLFARETFLELPRFDHMHRFLPALFMREGARVISVPVNHRPRLAGFSKYGMLDRLGAGIVDLAGVMWLVRRACPGAGSSGACQAVVRENRSDRATQGCEQPMRISQGQRE